MSCDLQTSNVSTARSYWLHVDKFLRNQPHDEHICENRSCPLPCQLCKRLCASANHLHAFEEGAFHLCGLVLHAFLWFTYKMRAFSQEHPCPATCQSQGICRIETAPQSVEATFTGRHETFQYTKVCYISREPPFQIGF